MICRLTYLYSYHLPWVKGLSVKGYRSLMTTRPHIIRNLNTPYSTYINKMPTSTTDWTWTKADDPRGTANGINLGEGQFSSRQMVGQGSINYANSFRLAH
ncbi:hypothetical protein NXV15_24150 [Bacteroides thetaiotaomicron]|nr:hypothetical protein [Bacteroides thetaiotaomicron]